MQISFSNLVETNRMIGKTVVSTSKSAEIADKQLTKELKRFGILTDGSKLSDPVSTKKIRERIGSLWVTHMREVIRVLNEAGYKLGNENVGDLLIKLRAGKVVSDYLNTQKLTDLERAMLTTAIWETVTIMQKSTAK